MYTKIFYFNIPIREESVMSLQVNESSCMAISLVWVVVELTMGAYALSDLIVYRVGRSLGIQVWKQVLVIAYNNWYLHYYHKGGKSMPLKRVMSHKICAVSIM